MLCKFKTFVIVIGLAGFLTVGIEAPSYAGGSCATPIPDNVKVEDAPQGTPKGHAAFLGAWGDGEWDGVLCNTLVVEAIDEEGNVKLIYSWGTYAGWNIWKGSVRAVGKFLPENRLRFTFRGGARVVTYWLEGGKLKGTYEYDWKTSRVTLSPKPSVLK